MFKVSDEAMIRYVNTLSHEIEIFYKNNRPYARIHKIGGTTNIFYQKLVCSSNANVLGCVDSNKYG